VKGEPAKILDHNRTSIVGLVIPDPAMMTSTNLKFATFEEDRLKVSRRKFQQSGLMSLSPRNTQEREEMFGTPSRTGSRGRRIPGKQALINTIERFNNTAHK